MHILDKHNKLFGFLYNIAGESDDDLYTN